MGRAIYHAVQPVVRQLLSADIFPVHVALTAKGSCRSDAHQPHPATPTATALYREPTPTSSSPEELAAHVRELDFSSLKRFVQERGWNGGGGVRLSGRGRTQACIRADVLQRILNEKTEVPVSGTTVEGPSAETSLTCTKQRYPSPPPSASPVGLSDQAAHVLQTVSDRNPCDRSTRQIRWAGYRIGIQPRFSFRSTCVSGIPCVSVILKHVADLPRELHLGSMVRAGHEAGLRGLKVCALPYRALGIVVGFKGRLGADGLRERLLKLVSSEETRQMILTASDDEACWDVKLNKLGQSFTYLASCLQPLISINNQEYLSKLVANAADVTPILQASILRPSERQVLVDERMRQLASDSFVRDFFPSGIARITSQMAKVNFTTFAMPEGVVGGQERLKQLSGAPLWAGLQKNGLYKYEAAIGRDLLLRGYILQQDPSDAHRARADATFAKIAHVLRSLHLKVDAPSTVCAVPSTKAALDHAKAEGAQGVIFFSTYGADASNYYHEAKLQCFQTPAPGLWHMASQWIDLCSQYQHDQYALANVALGFCAKLGHTPYVLDGISGVAADRVICGIDICHLMEPHSGETTHMLTGLRLQAANGEMEKSYLFKGQINGEGVPDKIWRAMLPVDACAGKDVVVHRDGKFTKDERSFLDQRAKESGSKGGFNLVEIVKYAAGTPRLYEGDQNPPNGTFLRLTESEGILTTSDHRSRGTRNPLLVRTVGGPADLEKIAEEVFRMSLLNYGSVWSNSRLPVTTRTADIVAYLHAHMASRADCGGTDDLHYTGRQQYWL